MNDNELIAKFMGANPFRQYAEGETMEYEMYGVIPSIEDGPDEKHFFTPEQMKFSEDWNWLMAVVDKIDCMDDYRFTVKMHWHFTEILDNNDKGVTLVDVGVSGDRLKNTYDAVIKFIKLYKDLVN